MGEVVNLFKKKEEKKAEKIKKNLDKLVDAATEKEEEKFDFEAIMKKNNANKQRVTEERAKANKSVVRSQGLKK